MHEVIRLNSFVFSFKLGRASWKKNPTLTDFERLIHSLYLTIKYKLNRRNDYIKSTRWSWACLGIPKKVALNYNCGGNDTIIAVLDRNLLLSIFKIQLDANNTPPWPLTFFTFKTQFKVKKQQHALISYSCF